MPSALSSEALRLRNHAACALLEKIDQNKHRHLTSGERINLLTEVTEERQLKRLRNGALVPYDQDRALYNLLCSFREYYDPVSFTEGGRPSVDDLFRHGSSILQSSFLQNVGYHADMAQEQPSVSLGSPSVEQSHRVDGYQGTAAEGVAQNDNPANEGCTSIRFNPMCEGNQPRSLVARGRYKYCASCQDWLRHEKENLRMIGCTNPERNPDCWGKNAGSYQRIGQHIYCWKCQRLHYQKEHAKDLTTPEAEVVTVQPRTKRAITGHATAQKPTRQASIAAVSVAPVSKAEHDPVNGAQLPLDLPSLKRTHAAAFDTIRVEQTSARASQAAQTFRGSLDDEHEIAMLMRKSELQKTWANLMEDIMSTAVSFLTMSDSNSSRSNKAAQFVHQPSPELEGLYNALSNKHKYLLLEWQESKKLEEFQALLSLVGAVAESIINPSSDALDMHLLTLPDERIRMLLQAVDIQGVQADEVLQSVNFTWVSCQGFSKIHVEPEVAKLSPTWTCILRPHLAIIHQQSSARPRRLYECLEVFEQHLDKIVRRCLVLHAQLKVVGGYHLVRPHYNSLFDFPTMGELNQATDRTGLRVTLAVLPGLVKTDTEGKESVICKTVVVTHRDQAPREQSQASADLRQIQVEMARHNETTSANEVEGRLHNSGLEGRLEVAVVIPVVGEEQLAFGS